MSAPVEDAAAPAAELSWLREGQRLEAGGRLQAALACYDRALADAGTCQPAGSLAWMNRGSVLQRFGDRERAQAALAAYDAAIAGLRHGGTPETTANTISLAAAWMNRGQLLLRLEGTVAAAAVFDACRAGEDLLVSLLQTDGTAPDAARRNLGGIRVNRATLRLDLGDAGGAAEDARQALAAVAPIERADLAAATVALMARRALCAALGRLLVAPGADQDALAAEASDLVDDALALARSWGAAGRDAFAPLVTRLFRFGAGLYRAHQPQFLGEFLLEQLEVAAPPEHRAIADASLAGALADLQRPRPLVAGTPATERLLAAAQNLRAAQARLLALESAEPPTVLS